MHPIPQISYQQEYLYFSHFLIYQQVHPPFPEKHHQVQQLLRH